MGLKNLMSGKKIIAAVVALALLVGGGWYYFGSAPKDAQVYKTAKIEQGYLTQSVSANGVLNPVVLVNVGTQVSGTVKKLMVDYNDKVKAGQVLAVLDPSLFDAQMAQSEASVRSAEASLELAAANEKRMRELYAKEFVSKQELDQSVQALKSAKAQLALSKAQHKKDAINKEYSIIKSPVSGVVIDRQVDVGQTVAASFQTPTLFKIAQDLRRMQIDSSFAEADIGSIKVGQEVSFSVDAFPNRVFKGVVRQIRLNATTQSNVVTYNVVVSVDNPDEKLMPGMTAYVNIKTAERNNTLLVPNAALRYRPSNIEKQPTMSEAKTKKKEDGAGRSATVYKLENGAPKAVKIVVGITDNKQTEIISGPLKVGDTVIIDENTKNVAKSQSAHMRLF